MEKETQIFNIKFLKIYFIYFPSPYCIEYTSKIFVRFQLDSQSRVENNI